MTTRNPSLNVLYSHEDGKTTQTPNIDGKSMLKRHHHVLTHSLALTLLVMHTSSSNNELTLKHPAAVLISIDASNYWDCQLLTLRMHLKNRKTQKQEFMKVNTKTPGSSHTICSEVENGVMADSSLLTPVCGHLLWNGIQSTNLHALTHAHPYQPMHSLSPWLVFFTLRFKYNNVWTIVNTQSFSYACLTHSRTYFLAHSIVLSLTYWTTE